MSLLQRMHELPFDFIKDTFFRYANVITCCTGVEVSRQVANREEVDCIVPNTFLAWETYVDGQPEFTNVQWNTLVRTLNGQDTCLLKAKSELEDMFCSLTPTTYYDFLAEKPFSQRKPC